MVACGGAVAWWWRSVGVEEGVAPLPALMLTRIAEMGNQLPPRIKALLNLAITIILVLLSMPYLWLGLTTPSFSDASLGLGLLLLGIFNMFT